MCNAGDDADGVDGSTHFVNPRISRILLKSPCVTVNPPSPRALADPFSAFFLYFLSPASLSSRVRRAPLKYPEFPKGNQPANLVNRANFQPIRRRISDRISGKQSDASVDVIFIDARARRR